MLKIVKVYMTSYAFLNLRVLKQYMAQALTSGLGTGSAIALFLKLLDRVDRVPPPSLTDPGAVCSILRPDPPAVHWASVIVGICIGLFIGIFVYPICELLLSYRYLVLRIGWSGLQQDRGEQRGARPLYRFLQ